MKRAVSHNHAVKNAYARVTLDHAERHLRRKKLTLDNGEAIMVDLPKATQLAAGDCLLLESGEEVEIIAAKQKLFMIRGFDFHHLAELCWHLGNRHRAAEIKDDHILIESDPVLRTMLEGLGADIEEVEAAFQPVRGAYHDNGHDHAHTHTHAHSNE